MLYSGIGVAILIVIIIIIVIIVMKNKNTEEQNEETQKQEQEETNYTYKVQEQNYDNKAQAQNEIVYNQTQQPQQTQTQQTQQQDLKLQENTEKEVENQIFEKTLQEYKTNNSLTKAINSNKLENTDLTLSKNNSNAYLITIASNDESTFKHILIPILDKTDTKEFENFIKILSPIITGFDLEKVYINTENNYRTYAIIRKTQDIEKIYENVKTALKRDYPNIVIYNNEKPELSTHLYLIPPEDAKETLTVISTNPDYHKIESNEAYSEYYNTKL